MAEGLSPYQQVRFWLRRAPREQQVTAAIVGLIVIGVLASVALSNGDSNEDGSSGIVAQGRSGTTTSTPRGMEPADAPPANATATTIGPAPAGRESTSAAGPVPGTTCAPPPGSAQGITASELKVGVSMTSISGPGANELFGIPSPAKQEQIYKAVIHSVNAEGGIACRKVVPEFFEVNPTNQTDMHEKCLSLGEMAVYANLDAGGFANFHSRSDCFARHRIAYVGSFLYGSEESAGHPYLFSLAQYDRSYRDTVLALRDRGFFAPANGFKRLGFIYRDCQKYLVPAMRGWLREAGLTDQQVEPFSVGCPSAFASPADLQQAVLTFQRTGVTHVTTMSFLGDMANFTKIAEHQRFRPKYGLADDQLIAISYGNLRPDPANINGAIAITNTRNAEERTPGMTPSSSTQRCDAYLREAGLKPTWEQAPFAGLACNIVWMLKAAADHAPSIGQSDLAVGLQRARSVDFSYPSAPTDFGRNRTTSGGHFWRVAEYQLQCECWRIVDREFRPTYPG